MTKSQKNYLYPAILAFPILLLSCNKASKSDEGEEVEKATSAVIAPPVDGITLEKKDDGLFYAKGSEKPFTGIDVEIVPLFSVDKEIPHTVSTPYTDGRIDGTKTIYFPSGKKIKEERVYKAGEAIQSTVYYSSGQKKIFVELNHKDVAEGEYKRWHANGALQTDGAHDENERFHGEAKEYDDAGKLEGHYIWQNGKLMDIKFESPKLKEERLVKYGEFTPPAPVPAP